MTKDPNPSFSKLVSTGNTNLRRSTTKMSVSMSKLPFEQKDPLARRSTVSNQNNQSNVNSQNKNDGKRMQKYLTSNTAPARQGTVIKKMKPGIQKEPEEQMPFARKSTVKKETISAFGKAAPTKLDQKPSILATST